MLDSLPDVLIHDILKHSGPVDKIRAAATCQAVRRVYDDHNKQLTSHSLTFTGSMGVSVPPFPYNIKQLFVTVGGNSNNGNTRSISANVYKEVELFVECAQQDQVLHFNNVQELGINCVDMPGWMARRCVQKLLQLLPNLTTVWVGASESLQLLAHKVFHSLPSLRRLSVMLPVFNEALTRLPALPHDSNTLCITVHGPIGVFWLQPLSQMPHLRYLSLTLGHMNGLQQLSRVTALQHLKLRSKGVLDMRCMPELQQLKSLCLSETGIICPAALTQLNVTSITLQSVRLSEPQFPSIHRWIEPQPTELCWPQLTRVHLSGTMSEQLMQAMLLPHPTGLCWDTKASFDTFDKFDSDFQRVMISIQTPRSKDTDVIYHTDAPPALGPAYLAAIHPQSLEIRGHHAVEALRQLLLLNSTVCLSRWHKLLLSSQPLMRVPFRLRGDQHVITVTNNSSVADGPESILIESAGLSCRFARQSSSAKCKVTVPKHQSP